MQYSHHKEHKKGFMKNWKRSNKNVTGNNPVVVKKAVEYAQTAVHAINKHMGFPAAHVARHNQSGELAAIVIEAGNVDVKAFPSIDETKFILPPLPQNIEHNQGHGLFFEAYSPNRLNIW